MLADDILLGLKYQDTIAAYAQFANLDLRTAMDVFYKSRLYIEMSEGSSDMHCRSDGYLAEELHREQCDRGLPGGQGAGSYAEMPPDLIHTL